MANQFSFFIYLIFVIKWYRQPFNQSVRNRHRNWTGYCSWFVLAIYNKKRLCLRTYFLIVNKWKVYSNNILVSRKNIDLFCFDLFYFFVKQELIQTTILNFNIHTQTDRHRTRHDNQLVRSLIMPSLCFLLLSL